MTKTYQRSGFGVKGDLTVEIVLPDWIKKAKRNRKARIKRYAKRHSISLERAEQILNDRSEEIAQETETW